MIIPIKNLNPKRFTKIITGRIAGAQAAHKYKLLINTLVSIDLLQLKGSCPSCKIFHKK